jgi:hypothetical protein
MAGEALSQVQSQMSSVQYFANTAVSSAQIALSTLASIDLGTNYAASYSFSAPAIHLPSAASIPGALTIGTAPTIADISIPTKVTKPFIDTVTLGEILAITLPEIPTVSFPSLTLDAPVYSITAPAEWSFGVNTNILITDDPLIQAAIDRLTSNIKNGGTGLSATIEADIWARDLERNEQQLEDSTDKIIQLWAKKGFSLPDGMLANSLSDVQKEYMNRKLDRSREIAIEQAKLEQSNLFKSLELTVSLADKLINMLIRYEELVFKTQEATARFANEYIDLQIKTYASKVEAYKATATVHEMLIRAEMAKVELYRAEIEAQKAIGDVNKLTVEVYSERLKATTIIIDRYKTEVSAMVSELEVEKAKIESNKLQMDAWAKSADVNIAKYSGEVEMYKAASQVSISTAEIYNRQAEANMRAAIAAMEANVRGYEVQERGIIAKANITMEAARGVAQATAHMAAGAVSAMSAHASMGYSESMALTEA